MADTLGIALSKLLVEYEPELLVSDLDAIARATAELSALLGCILASVAIKNPAGYQDALLAIMRKINQSAEETAAAARHIAETTNPNGIN